MLLPSFADKLRFLHSTPSLWRQDETAETVETHMSWLFFTRHHVLKLKKPVRFAYLDFSTLAEREFYCREELRLNARLAPGVYLDLMALEVGESGLALVHEADIATRERVVEWLVRMRRLPAERMLPALIAGNRVAASDVDDLAAVLVSFYRRARRVAVSPTEYLARLQREQATDRELLLRPCFALDGAATALDRLDGALVRWAPQLAERAATSCIVDGHGDLRPEHVCLLVPPLVIDCLEFNAELRQVDPFDEFAFLALECERAGAAWIGKRLAGAALDALGMAPPPPVMQIYTARRALLRARLAAAHLLEPQPRTPHKWLPLAGHYVACAIAALDGLDAAPWVNAARNRDTP